MQYGIITDANIYRGQPDAWRSAAEDMQAHGMRMAMTPTGNLETFDMMLTVCDALGFSLLGSAAEELDREWWTGPLTCNMKNARQLVTKYFEPLRHHPSLSGWYLYDEPMVAGDGALTNRLRTITRAIRESDDLPMFATIANEANGAVILMQTGPDIACPFWYPITAGLPEQTLADLLNEPFLDDVLVTRPLALPFWLIGQGHSGDAFNLREPTIQELGAQTENAERRGAEWFVWFAYESQADAFTGLKDNPTLWTEVGRLAGVGVPDLPPPIVVPGDGLGVPRPEISGDIEAWWAAHPLRTGAPIQPSPETQVVRLPSGRHAIGDIIGPGNIHYIGDDGAVIDISGGMRIGPSDFAFAYHTGLTEAVANGDPAARWLVSGGRLKNVYFSNLIFDHGGGGRSISLAACDGVMWEDCRFINANYTGSFHAGHLNGNACLDHIWFRRCTFEGGFRHPVYLDGAHGSGMIDCRFSGRYAGSGPLYLCNNDFTVDMDNNGDYEPNELRMASYIIMSGVGSDVDVYSLVEVTGGPLLVEHCRAARTTSFVYQARKAHWQAVYDQRGVVVRNNMADYAQHILAIQRGADESAGSAPTLVGDLRVSGNTTDVIDQLAATRAYPEGPLEE